MDNIKHSLTVKQKAFTDLYIQTGNATQSYIDAGYKASKRNIAEVEGHKLLRNPKIISYLDEVNSVLNSDSIADMKEVKEFWTTTMRTPFIDRKDRLKASEMIARTNGAFLERIEHTGNVKINNPFDEMSVDELRKLAEIDD